MITRRDILEEEADANAASGRQGPMLPYVPHKRSCYLVFTLPYTDDCTRYPTLSMPSDVR